MPARKPEEHDTLAVLAQFDGAKEAGSGPHTIGRGRTTDQEGKRK